MFKQILPAIKATAVIALLTGFLFPVVFTFVAQLIFPAQANGSLVKNKAGQVIGSSLIGQQMTAAKYFHPRPSAAGSGYAGEASSGTNLGSTSSKLILGLSDDPATKDVDESYPGVKQLVHKYREENKVDAAVKIPVDAVTRSASGLDPHISLANALLQTPRVAQNRGMKPKIVDRLVHEQTEERQLGFLGEPRVNVLLLNMALDNAKP